MLGWCLLNASSGATLVLVNADEEAVEVNEIHLFISFNSFYCIRYGTSVIKIVQNGGKRE